MLIFFYINNNFFIFANTKTKRKTNKPINQPLNQNQKMPEKSYQDIWNNCLTIISDNVSVQNFKTWFKPIKAVALNEKILTIQVPSQFFYEW